MQASRTLRTASLVRMCISIRVCQPARTAQCKPRVRFALQRRWCVRIFVYVYVSRLAQLNASLAYALQYSAAGAYVHYVISILVCACQQQRAHRAKVTRVSFTREPAQAEGTRANMSERAYPIGSLAGVLSDFPAVI